jgi:hypothetical protein
MPRKIPVNVKLFVGGGSLKSAVTVKLQEELTKAERAAWKEQLIYSDARWGNKGTTLKFSYSSSDVFDHTQLLRHARQIRDRFNLEVRKIKSEGCRMCEGSIHVRHRRPAASLEY